MSTATPHLCPYCGELAVLTVWAFDTDASVAEPAPRSTRCLAVPLCDQHARIVRTCKTCTAYVRRYGCRAMPGPLVNTLTGEEGYFCRELWEQAYAFTLGELRRAFSEAAELPGEACDCGGRSGPREDRDCDHCSGCDDVRPPDLQGEHD
jgi:hypothetical protein